MEHKALTIIFCLFLTQSLSGCVTEKSYVDSSKQVKSLDFDKTEAAKSRLLLALAYLRNDNYPQAKANLDKALEFAPERADVHYSYAYYYQKVSEPELAENSYVNALEIEPSNPDTLNNFGSFLCQIGKFDLAIRYLKQAIKTPKYGQVARSYLNLAYCEIEAGNFSQALAYSTLASRHDPKSSEIVLTTASLHYGLGNLTNALSWYQELESLSSATAESLEFGILLNFALANDVVAHQLKEQLISSFPSSTSAILVKTNHLSMSRFELLAQKIQQGAGEVQSNLVTIKHLDTKVSTETDIEKQPLLLNQDKALMAGIHSVNAINKENSLPTEELVDNITTVSDDQMIERPQWLAIPTVKLSIPTYRVQFGENLYRISVKFNIQISTLMKWNNLKKQQVNTEQLLYIRNPDVYYVVEQAQKLSEVAQHLNISLNKLMLWNQVQHDGLVKVKTKILKVDPSKYQ